MLPEAKLDTLIARHAEVEAELSGQLAGDAFVRLSREFAELSPIVETVKTYRAVANEIADLEAMKADPATDADMREIADAELLDLQARRDKLEQDIRVHLIPKDAMDDRNVILEIRAGTGGDEASLFAGVLFRMYERYAAKQGWKTEVMSESPGSVGGFKEIVAEIRGRGAFSKLKFESGVHRVQRVPDTEASGRIHTSAATVAVLPEVEDVDVTIRDEDLKIDTLRASGAGGQHVNKTESAIRITHLPSGHRDRDAGRPLAASQQGEGDGDPALAGFTSTNARSATPRARPTGATRSAPATAPSASAPTISRKGASPIIAST